MNRSQEPVPGERGSYGKAGPGNTQRANQKGNGKVGRTTEDPFSGNRQAVQAVQVKGRLLMPKVYEVDTAEFLKYLREGKRNKRPEIWGLIFALAMAALLVLALLKL